MSMAPVYSQHRYHAKMDRPFPPDRHLGERICKAHARYLETSRGPVSQLHCQSILVHLAHSLFAPGGLLGPSKPAPPIEEFLPGFRPPFNPGGFTNGPWPLACEGRRCSPDVRPSSRGLYPFPTPPGSCRTTRGVGMPSIMSLYSWRGYVKLQRERGSPESRYPAMRLAMHTRTSSADCTVVMYLSRSFRKSRPDI